MNECVYLKWQNTMEKCNMGERKGTTTYGMLYDINFIHSFLTSQVSMWMDC